MADLKKNLIVPYGEWQGHSAGAQKYGPDEAAKIVERFNALVKSSGNPVQIDYDHQSLDADRKNGPVPAAGFIHELVAEDDGIYGMVEWTDRATDLIKAGEYRYLSPVIASGLPDPVTGEEIEIELFNAAVTNQPFMHDRMQRLAASAIKEADGHLFYTNSKQLTLSNSTGGNMPDLQQTVDGIIAALDGAKTADDVMNFLKKATEVLAIMPGAPEGGAMPTDEEGMGAMMTATRKALAYAKTLEDVAAHLKVEPDKVLPTVAAMSSKATDADTLAAKVADLEAKQNARDIADLIDNSTRIAPAQRDHWRKFAKDYGIEAARTAIEQLPEIIPAKPNKTVANAETIDAERLALAQSMGLSEDDIKKYSRKPDNKEA